MHTKKAVAALKMCAVRAPVCCAQWKRSPRALQSLAPFLTQSSDQLNAIIIHKAPMRSQSKRRRGIRARRVPARLVLQLHTATIQLVFRAQAVFGVVLVCLCTTASAPPATTPAPAPVCGQCEGALVLYLYSYSHLYQTLSTAGSLTLFANSPATVKEQLAKRFKRIKLTMNVIVGYSNL